MTVVKDLTVTSSLGLSVDLTVSSAVNPLPHALRDLTLMSGVTLPSFQVDLALSSGAARYGGSGGRARRRRTDIGVSA